MRPERRVDDDKRQDAERQIDQKYPAPGKIVDDEPAEQRTDHRREPEYAAEESLIVATFAWRHDVADDRDRGDDQTAAAETLHDAECDQLGKVLRNAAKRRPDQENDDGRLQDGRAAEEVAELAVKRHHHRRGQEISRDDPREMRQSADLADDRWQGRRDDRLVERSKQQNERKCRENCEPVALAGFWAEVGRSELMRCMVPKALTSIFSAT